MREKKVMCEKATSYETSQQIVCQKKKKKAERLITDDLHFFSGGWRSIEINLDFIAFKTILRAAPVKM